MCRDAQSHNRAIREGGALMKDFKVDVVLIIECLSVG